MPEREIAQQKAVNVAEGLVTKFSLSLIRFYRNFISPLKPQVCRFYPSCSQYTYDALVKYGFFKGIYLGFRRILRCHPFNPGGYNPVE